MTAVSGIGRRARASLRKRLRARAWDSQMHPRLAFCGPLPPARTGVASYDAAVLESLRSSGFTQRHRMDVLWPIRPQHEGTVPWYRLGIYQLGNNVEFHRDVYRFACTAPGLAVLHDLALDDFVRGLKTAGDPLGYAAEREALRLRGTIADPDVLSNEPLSLPWCAHVVRRSRGVIVHSDFGSRYLESFGSKTPVFVVPHPVVESDADVATAMARGRSIRREHAIAQNDVLVVAPGDLNAAKQLGPVLRAISASDGAVKGALVGRRIEGFDVEPVISEAAVGERAILATDVGDRDFLGWLAAADIVVDLRFPHRGEVSGSLQRAMQLGRPCIVSATGSYLDLPDAAVVRVAAGPADPVEIAARIGDLAGRPELRSKIGDAARGFIASGRDATAGGYEEAISSTLGLVRDPVRKAEARWAAALADLGVDEAAIADGYGLAYARALEGFREPATDGT